MNLIRKINPQVVHDQLVKDVAYIDRAIGTELSFHSTPMSPAEELEASENLRLSTSLPSALWGTVDLLQHSLENRSIPASKQKLFTTACKALLNRARMQLKAKTNLFALWRKNRPFCLIAIDSFDWPEREVGGKDKFQVGSFMIHNTLGVSVEGITKNIETAEHLVKNSSVKGIARVLYGDVYIVDRIQGKLTLAWYDQNKDMVFVRDSSQYSLSVTETLVHELGHRYWAKFSNIRDKEAWVRFYEEVGTSGKPPSIGIGAKFQAGNSTMTVSKIVADKVFCEESSNPKEYYKLMDVIRALRVQHAQLQYPTPYASKNYEEFFCESLRLYALDRLHAPFKERFEAIFC